MVELVGRRGAEGVAGGQEDRLALVLEPLGQLGDRGRLARAVDPGDQVDRRLARGDGQGPRPGVGEQGLELVLDEREQVLVGGLVGERLADAVDDPGRWRATPTSAWISRASRSSRNDWSTLRPNQDRTLNNWAVFASPFLKRSSRLLIAIAVLTCVHGADQRAASPVEAGRDPSRRRPRIRRHSGLDRGRGSEAREPFQVGPGRGDRRRPSGRGGRGRGSRSRRSGRGRAGRPRRGSGGRGGRRSPGPSTSMAPRPPSARVAQGRLAGDHRRGWARPATPPAPRIRAIAAAQGSRGLATSRGAAVAEVAGERLARAGDLAGPRRASRPGAGGRAWRGGRRGPAPRGRRAGPAPRAARPSRGAARPAPSAHRRGRRPGRGSSSRTKWPRMWTSRPSCSAVSSTPATSSTPSRAASGRATARAESGVVVGDRQRRRGRRRRGDDDLARRADPVGVGRVDVQVGAAASAGRRPRSFGDGCRSRSDRPAVQVEGRDRGRRAPPARGRARRRPGGFGPGVPAAPGSAPGGGRGCR